MLYYETYNNKKPEWAVFIHGIGGSTKTWKKQIEDFSQSYNLLLLDLPGHGNSSGIKEFNIEAVCSLIIEVMDDAGIASADIISMSLGSMVASHLAVLYPTRVKSLTQGGATLRVDGFNKLLMETADKVKHILPVKLTYGIFARVIMPKKNHRKSRNIFIREAVKMNRKDFIRWVSILHESVHPRKLIKGLRGLPIKMHFISGDEDRCFLEGVKRCVDALPQATLSIIERCGHVCSIEKAEEFNSKALFFLHHNCAT